LDPPSLSEYNRKEQGAICNGFLHLICTSDKNGFYMEHQMKVVLLFKPDKGKRVTQRNCYAFGGFE